MRSAVASSLAFCAALAAATGCLFSSPRAPETEPNEASSIEGPAARSAKAKQDDELLHAIRSSESSIGAPAPPVDEGPLLDCMTEAHLCIGPRINDISAASLERKMTETDKLTIELHPSTVADLETLTKLPWVTRLRIEPEGKIDSLAVLAQLKQLRGLTLPAALLPLLARAGELGHVERVTVRPCDANGTADLGALKALVGLKALDLAQGRCGNVADLAPLAGIAGLEDLDASFTSVDRLDPLKGLTKLRVVRFAWTRVGSVAPLAALPSVVALDMSSTSVRDFSPLKAMTGLRGLKVSGLKDLSVLTGLKDLESLSLEPGVERELRPTDLQPLSGLTKLRRLDVSGTFAHSLVPLAGLAQLESLDLRGVCARDLRPLVPLTHLRWLELSTGALAPSDRAALEKGLPDLRISESGPPARCND
jgi:Leucine-rich repeat (LRR) protein